MNKLKSDILGFDNYCKMMEIAPCLHGFVMLMMLHEHGEMKFTDLCEKMGLSLTVATPAIKKLKRDGSRTLVYRRVATNQGGTVSYYLAPETKVYMDQIFGLK